MTDSDESTRREPAAGLEVQLAAELIERAKAEGVSLVGPGGLLSGVTKTVLQAALDAEMSEHLGYDKGERPAVSSGNHRNGTSAKTVLTEVGPVGIEVPRDRKGEFEPRIVPKHARRIEGFDEAIVSLYAKGLTTGEIRSHLGEIYGVQVSRDLISRVTDRVAQELAVWQSRPLDAVYPVVLIDALWVKIRDGQVANRPVYVALGIIHPASACAASRRYQSACRRAAWLRRPIVPCAGERDVLGCGSAPAAGAPNTGWACCRSCVTAASPTCASPAAVVKIMGCRPGPQPDPCCD